MPISVYQARSHIGKMQQGRYLRVRPANVVSVLGEVSLHGSRVPSIVANPLRFNSISNCEGAALLVALEGCEHAAIVRPEPAGRGLCSEIWRQILGRETTSCIEETWMWVYEEGGGEAGTT